ncbi:helix-turn-helix transcriptional regulator [Streptomyces sp. NPDC056638]|uniref:helix-turn-helix domain-containing protein n=1 Tax=Streptomyces sp. NPDC056638 TaxID=3345887 RepID=UPI0036829E0B
MEGQEQVRTGPFEAARGLGENDLAVYGWVLEHRTGDPEAVSEATGIGPEEAGLSLERLRRARLLHAQNVPGGSRELFAVRYLCEIFEQTWDRATPFADAVSQGLEEVSREIHETIVRLLAAGLKDEAIARRLGMSLRTARRHIADIMEELDATSRFQAGAHAAARGLLGNTAPEAESPDGPVA